MDDKKIVKEKMGEAEAPEAPVEALPEMKENAETGEMPDAGNLRQLKESVEKMDLDDALKPQINVSAQSIQSLTAQKKIQQLLAMAKEKGVIYAVHVAKNLGDAYVLDMLHDELVKSGQYKEFLK